MAKSIYEILLKIEGEDKIKSSLDQIGTQLGLTGAALTAFSAGAAKLAADYETALANVATVSSEATGTTEEFSQRLFQLQSDMNGAINVQQAAVTAYDALSAGIKDQDAVIAALGLSQKAAIAGQSDLNSVMSAAISGVNSYGESLGVGTDQVAQFDKVINLMLQTQLDGVITADQYARSFGQIASLANSSGVSLEVLNAAIATTTSKGIPASIAFTNLKAAISNITGPTSIAKEEAEKLGIEFNATALQAKGLDGLLRDIFNSENFNDNTINNLFGSTEARGSIAALIGDMDLLDQNIQNQINGLGALDKTYEMVADTANRKVLNAINQIQGALIEIGQGAMVLIAPVIEMFGNLAQAISELPGWAKQLVGGFTLLAGVSLTLVGAGALLVTTLASLITSYGTLTTAMGINLAAMKASTAQSLMLSGSVTNLTLAKIAAAKSVGVFGVALKGMMAKLVTLAPLLAKFAAFAGVAWVLKVNVDQFVEANSLAKGITESTKNLNDELKKIQGIPQTYQDSIDAVNDELSFMTRQLDKVRDFWGWDTVAETAVARADAAFAELTQTITDVRLEATRIATDIEKGLEVDPTKIKQSLESIEAAITTLRETPTTSPQQEEAVKVQIENLERLKGQINGTTQETQENTETNEDNTQSVEDAAKAWDEYKTKMQGAMAAIDAQKDVDLGNLTGSDTDKISEGLRVEQDATAKKIALLEDLKNQSKTTAEERRDIEIEIQKLMLDANQKRIEANKQLEEKYNQFQRDRLSIVRAEFERSVVEQGLTNEQAYNKRVELLNQEYNLEKQILQDRIANSAQHSGERKALEAELAELSLGYAKDKKTLDDELASFQKSKIDEVKQAEKQAIDEKIQDNKLYFDAIKEGNQEILDDLTIRKNIISDISNELDIEAGILGRISSLLNSDNTTLAQRKELIGLASELTGQTFRTNQNMSAMEQASLAIQKTIAENEVRKIELKIRQLELDRESLKIQTEIANLAIQNQRADIQDQLGSSDLSQRDRDNLNNQLRSLDRQEEFNTRSAQITDESLGVQLDLANFEKELASIMARNIGGPTSNDLVSRAEEASKSGNTRAEREAIRDARSAYNQGTITREDLDQILETSREEARKRAEDAQKEREESQKANETRTQSNEIQSEGFSRVGDNTQDLSGLNQGLSEMVRVSNEILSTNRQISTQLSDIAQRVSSLPSSIASLIPRPSPAPSNRR